ncbi:SRPBCC family protein [Streptomyces sp. NPDC059740]|uniref:SRPBCC family protein n=1 Tax=Streptomyces sp. NPDC059740 TaxID=3346926 RepID=UPI003649E06D
MPEDKSDGGTFEALGLDRLRDELLGLLEAGAEHLADAAGKRISELAGQLTDVADGGSLAGVGSKLLKGESPLKALVSQKAKDAKDKVVGSVKKPFGGGGDGGGDGGGGRPGDIKATNIIESVDIGVPLRTVYDQWTQYEDFSTFTKGVQSVKGSDDVESKWTIKVCFSSRSWDATIQEQVPDERIMWTSEGSQGSTSGVVSFHEITPTLTRVVVVVEYYPSGFVEKTANLWRAAGRRLRLDLKHFQRNVTLAADEDLEGWRGEIRDGEVVRSHEDAKREEEEQRGNGEGGEADRDEGETDDDYDEDDGYEEGDDEGYDEEDDEEPDDGDDEEDQEPEQDRGRGEGRRRR